MAQIYDGYDDDDDDNDDDVSSETNQTRLRHGTKHYKQWSL